ncbi:YdeI family stress tolerance OB fold protein [Escherichia coli]|uniref:YdeI family stress tolerance OB fold protein n=1 Tax=Escherichia coli TaxID=562 RepID=UPI0010CAD57A|nr:YdeI family stress tolerance OB fold protein [Escherichia coli]GCM28360.1 hydrogen peroxide resistance OB fold protein [Escherichia coli]
MKFQAIVLASFLVMPYALADDQGGLKQDAAPPPTHAIEDGYRGTDDAKKMTVDFAKNMHDGASVSLRGNLISHKGEDRYVFRDKSGEINVVIPAAVFDGREVQPDQMINISGSLDKKSAPAVVRVTHLQK